MKKDVERANEAVTAGRDRSRARQEFDRVGGILLTASIAGSAAAACALAGARGQDSLLALPPFFGAQLLLGWTVGLLLALSRLGAGINLGWACSIAYLVQLSWLTWAAIGSWGGAALPFAVALAIPNGFAIGAGARFGVQLVDRSRALRSELARYPWPSRTR